MAGDAGGTSFNSSFGDIVGAVGSLFGTSQSQSGSSSGEAHSKTTANLTGESRSRLEISDEAIDKIVADILSGPEGLAEIFSGENVAGIFNSTVATLQASDLVSNIVGEIAKLRAEKVDTVDQTQTSVTDQTQSQQTKTKSKDEGVLSGIGDFFGF